MDKTPNRSQPTDFPSTESTANQPVMTQEQADAWMEDLRAGRTAMDEPPHIVPLDRARVWVYDDEADAPPHPEVGFRLGFSTDDADIDLTVVPVPGGTLVHERTYLDLGVLIVEELFPSEDWLLALSRYATVHDPGDCVHLGLPAAGLGVPGLRPVLPVAA